MKRIIVSAVLIAVGVVIVSQYPIFALVGLASGLALLYYTGVGISDIRRGNTEEQPSDPIEQARKEYSEGKITEEEFEQRVDIAMKQQDSEADAEKEFEKVLR